MYTIIIILIAIIGQTISTIGYIMDNEICVYIGIAILFFLLVIHTKTTIHYLIIKHKEKELPWHIENIDKENEGEQ